METKTPSLYSADMPEGYEPGEHRGISDRPEDNLIPMIIVLQPLSPQLVEGNAKYVEGAKAGTILLRNSPGSGMVPGDQGFMFQPCDYRPIWIEWVDRERGGGFVARYADKNGVPDLPGVKRHPTNKFSFINPATGNSIGNHHNHVGFVILEDGTSLPALISFKGAGITESRNWMTMIPRERPDRSPSDSCDCAYKIIAVKKENPKGRWYDLRATERLGWVSKDQQRKGKALAEQFRAGEVQADYSEANDGETDDSM
jgi:hypothetical protein